MKVNLRVPEIDDQKKKKEVLLRSSFIYSHLYAGISRQLTFAFERKIREKNNK